MLYFDMCFFQSPFLQQLLQFYLPPLLTCFSCQRNNGQPETTAYRPEMELHFPTSWGVIRIRCT